MISSPVALITGSARRIGAVIATYLHAQGYCVVVHYKSSATKAEELCGHLNDLRQGSAIAVQADLAQQESREQLITTVITKWQRLDALVNNASSFYPTIFGKTTEEEWEDLFNSNLKGTFFLTQAAAPYLTQQRGNVVNITDIHAERPLQGYPVYSIAKAGLAMLTRSLAKELAPAVRVNAVAPGNILWPEGKNVLTPDQQQRLLNKIPLHQQGTPEDIAKAVWYLLHEATYTTGQILAIDGGRSLSL